MSLSITINCYLPQVVKPMTIDGPDDPHVIMIRGWSDYRKCLLKEAMEQLYTSKRRAIGWRFSRECSSRFRRYP